VNAQEEITKVAEEAMKLCPGAHAVVLFGSRARGTETARSDWDLAFITAEGDVPCALEGVAKNCLDALGMSIHAIEVSGAHLIQSARNPLALGRSLAIDGITLCGTWQRPIIDKESLVDRQDEYFSLLNQSLRSVRSFAQGVGQLGNSPDERWRTAVSSVQSLIADSCNAAEFCAKAISLRLQVKHAYTHDLRQIGKDLDKAGHHDIARLVTDLNGGTIKGHVKRYGNTPLSPEDAKGAMLRIQMLLPLLAAEAFESAFQVLDAEQANDLNTAAFLISAEQAIQEAGPVLFDENTPAHDRAAIEQVLAEQPAVVQALASAVAMISEERLRASRRPD